MTMKRPQILGILTIVVATHAGTCLAAKGTSASSGSETVRATRASGREAVASVRHDWKGTTRTLKLQGRTLNLSGNVPKNFGRMTPQNRLAYLHARRDLAPRRFDSFHRRLGRILGRDDRLKAAAGQDCRGMNGLVPNTPYWRYLRFRRNLAPSRFDVYHPALGAILARDQALREGEFCPPMIVMPNPGTPSPTQVAQILRPPGVPSPSGPTGGGPGVQAVPEPASLILVALGAGCTMVPRWMKRRRRLTS